MKLKIAVLAFAMVATFPAYAGDKDIQDLAAYTGMSERKVKMILGTRTAYAEYPYTYERYKTRFVRTLGKDNYQRLISGEPVRLSNGVVVRIHGIDQVAAAE